jgi:hypothetical protein
MMSSQKDTNTQIWCHELELKSAFFSIATVCPHLQLYATVDYIRTLIGCRFRVSNWSILLRLPLNSLVDRVYLPHYLDLVNFQIMRLLTTFLTILFDRVSTGRPSMKLSWILRKV